MKLLLQIFLKLLLWTLVASRTGHYEWPQSSLVDPVPSTRTIDPNACSGAGYVENVIRVTGSASSKLQQDQVTLTFNAEAEGPDSKKAIQYLNGIIQTAITRILALGIRKSELSTSQFSVNKIYDHRFNPSNQQSEAYLRNYKVKNTLVVKTKQLDIAGSVISTATEAGIKEIGKVEFSISEEKKESEKIALMGVASKDARQKAEMSLQFVGDEIEKIKLVQIKSDQQKPELPFYYPNISRGMSASSYPAMESTPLIASSEDMEVSVYVEFLLRKKPIV